MKNKLLFENSAWDVTTIERIAKECKKIADEELGLNCYDSSYEIITSEQMLDLYSSIAMPTGYSHWSYGKSFVREEQNYRSGRSGLAYEITSNTNPNIVYLMEENSTLIQTLVIAHCLGHNHFFKNNYMFTEWTDANFIIDYLVFAKKYIQECEEKYGIEEVEAILDSAHALKGQGVDKYKRPTKPTMEEEQLRQKEREEYIQQQVNILWGPENIKKKDKKEVFPEEPEENILKFIEKYSPVLKPWQREVVRIVRTISQYFMPQRQTKNLNEGFACWVHCYILKRLHDKGLLSDGAMLEFAHVHSNVIYQPSWEQGNFNPYALGLSMLQDIERICKNPTEEDKEWFPEIAGKDYIEVIKDCVENYRDESFIRQFLSPKLMRDMRMFVVEESDLYYTVTAIHNTRGYKEVRQELAAQYEIGNQEPNIQIVNANLNTDRTLELVHYMNNEQVLEEKDVIACMKHLRRLWGFTVSLQSVNSDGEIYEEYETD